MKLKSETSKKLAVEVPSRLRLTLCTRIGVDLVVERPFFLAAAEIREIKCKNPKNRRKLSAKHKKFEEIKCKNLYLESMDRIERQTDCTFKAGVQSSAKIDRQMWPLE